MVLASLVTWSQAPLSGYQTTFMVASRRLWLWTPIMISIPIFWLLSWKPRFVMPIEELNHCVPLLGTNLAGLCSPIGWHLLLLSWSLINVEVASCINAHSKPRKEEMLCQFWCFWRWRRDCTIYPISERKINCRCPLLCLPPRALCPFRSILLHNHLLIEFLSWSVRVDS